MGSRKGYYTPAYHELRMAVFNRDDWTCQFPGCGKRGTKKKKLQAHHIIPYSRGGPDELWNLVALCKPHHQVVDSLVGVR